MKAMVIDLDLGASMAENILNDLSIYYISNNYLKSELFEGW